MFTGKRIKLSFYELPLRSNRTDRRKKWRRGDITALRHSNHWWREARPRPKPRIVARVFAVRAPVAVLRRRVWRNCRTSTARFLRRRDRFSARRDSGRKARSGEEKESGREIGAGKCSVSTARSTGLRHQQLRDEWRPSVGLHSTLLRYITSLSSVQCTLYYTHAHCPAVESTIKWQDFR